MPNSRRNDYDITAEILEFTKVPRKKTEIIYRINLNFTMFEEYSTKMGRLGLLEEVPGNPSVQFQRTEKGTRFLKHYRELRRSMGKC